MASGGPRRRPPRVRQGRDPQWPPGGNRRGSTGTVRLGHGGSQRHGREGESMHARASRIDRAGRLDPEAADATGSGPATGEEEPTAWDILRAIWTSAAFTPFTPFTPSPELPTARNSDGS